MQLEFKKTKNGKGIIYIYIYRPVMGGRIDRTQKPRLVEEILKEILFAVDWELHTLHV